MIKTRQNNNMIHRIGLDFTENDNELSGLIELGVISDKT